MVEASIHPESSLVQIKISHKSVHASVDGHFFAVQVKLIPYLLYRTRYGNAFRQLAHPQRFKPYILIERSDRLETGRAVCEFHHLEAWSGKGSFVGSVTAEGVSRIVVYISFELHKTST